MRKKYVLREYDILNKRNTPKGFVDSCSHQGDCQSDVVSFMDRFEVPDIEYLKDFLREYGAWHGKELSNHSDNVMRLLWIAAGDIRENGEFIYGH